MELDNLAVGDGVMWQLLRMVGYTFADASQVILDLTRAFNVSPNEDIDFSCDNLVTFARSCSNDGRCITSARSSGVQPIASEV